MVVMPHYILFSWDIVQIISHLSLYWTFFWSSSTLTEYQQKINQVDIMLTLFMRCKFSLFQILKEHHGNFTRALDMQLSQYHLLRYYLYWNTQTNFQMIQIFNLYKIDTMQLINLKIQKKKNKWLEMNWSLNNLRTSKFLRELFK